MGSGSGLRGQGIDEEGYGRRGLRRGHRGGGGARSPRGVVRFARGASGSGVKGRALSGEGKGKLACVRTSIYVSVHIRSSPSCAMANCDRPPRSGAPAATSARSRTARASTRPEMFPTPRRRASRQSPRNSVEVSRTLRHRPPRACSRRTPRSPSERRRRSATAPFFPEGSLASEQTCDALRPRQPCEGTWGCAASARRRLPPEGPSPCPKSVASKLWRQGHRSARLRISSAAHGPLRRRPTMSPVSEPILGKTELARRGFLSPLLEDREGQQHLAVAPLRAQAKARRLTDDPASLLDEVVRGYLADVCAPGFDRDGLTGSLTRRG